MRKRVRKLEPITDGWEALVPPYVPRPVTTSDVLAACDVLMDAGFSEAALAVCSQVLITHPRVTANSYGGKTAAERRYEGART